MESECAFCESEAGKPVLSSNKTLYLRRTHHLRSSAPKNEKPPTFDLQPRKSVRKSVRRSDGRRKVFLRRATLFPKMDGFIYCFGSKNKHCISVPSKLKKIEPKTRTYYGRVKAGRRTAGRRVGAGPSRTGSSFT